MDVPIALELQRQRREVLRDVDGQSARRRSRRLDGLVLGGVVLDEGEAGLGRGFLGRVQLLLGPPRVLALLLLVRLLPAPGHLAGLQPERLEEEGRGGLEDDHEGDEGLAALVARVHLLQVPDHPREDRELVDVLGGRSPSGRLAAGRQRALCAQVRYRSQLVQLGSERENALQRI